RVARLAMPAFRGLGERDALPLHGAGKHRRWLLGRAGARIRVVDLGEVMAVDDDRVDAEGADACRVGAHVPLELGRAALTQPIHVDDRRELRKAFVTGVVEGLPDRTLSGLAVADE